MRANTSRAWFHLSAVINTYSYVLKGSTNLAEILKQTRSICSTCGEIIPASYEMRENNQVFFTRTSMWKSLCWSATEMAGTPIFPKGSLLLPYVSQQGWLSWK